MDMQKFFVNVSVIFGMFAATVAPVASPLSAESVSSSVSYEAIDAYVEQQMHYLNVPGVSLAIVEGDTITPALAGPAPMVKRLLRKRLFLLVLLRNQ